MGLMESANSLMGHTIYEQRVLEKKARLSEGFEEKLSDDEEDVEEGLDSIIDMEKAGPEDDEEGGELEGLEGGEEEGEEGEEELEMISVEDAIRAIQMVIDGEAETAEEAIEMVKSEGGEEGGELEAGEEGELEGGEDEDGEIDEKMKPKFKFHTFHKAKKGLTEEDDEEVEEVDECNDKGMKTKEPKADQYGESHSMFLKFAEKYLK